MALPLTEDQKPDLPGEAERLRAAGATMTASSQYGPARVWSSATGGCGLAMSRSIGDGIFSEFGVVATPETALRPLDKDDAWLVLASDGVWEFLDNERVVALVELHKHASDSCVQLVRLAAKAWHVEEGNEYRDDITAIVLNLPLLFPLRPPSTLSSTSPTTLRAESAVLPAREAPSFEEFKAQVRAALARLADRSGKLLRPPPAERPEEGAEFNYGSEAERAARIRPQHAQGIDRNRVRPPAVARRLMLTPAAMPPKEQTTAS